jgi:hypothetical protein
MSIYHLPLFTAFHENSTRSGVRRCSLTENTTRQNVKNSGTLAEIRRWHRLASRWPTYCIKALLEGSADISRDRKYRESLVGPGKKR